MRKSILYEFDITCHPRSSINKEGDNIVCVVMTATEVMRGYLGDDSSEFPIFMGYIKEDYTKRCRIRNLGTKENQNWQLMEYTDNAKIKTDVYDDMSQEKPVAEYESYAISKDTMKHFLSEIVTAATEIKDEELEEISKTQTLYQMLSEED